MSRLSRYNFDKAKYDAVNSDDYFPPDEPLEKLVAIHEREINEIVHKCTINKTEWNHNKLVYRAVESTTIFFSLSLSIVSLILVAVFFHKYLSAFQYIKEIGLIRYQLTSYLPIFYLVLESLSVFFDAIKALTSFRVFRIFAAESQNKKYINQRSIETDDYMLIYSENSITMKTIRNLRQRVNTKTELKKMFRPLIRLEVMASLYFYLFVIAPKIISASYIQINLMSHFGSNQTEYREIDTKYAHDFECCTSSNLTKCDTDWTEKECVHGSAGFFLQLLVIVFFVTAVIKFILQILLGANMKWNLIDNLVQKRYVEEINLKRKYDHIRSASFSVNVQARIEQNDAILADQVRMLYNKSSDLLPINEQSEASHQYAEIRL